jgi:hypothetical protein
VVFCRFVGLLLQQDLFYKMMIETLGRRIVKEINLSQRGKAVTVVMIEKNKIVGFP